MTPSEQQLVRASFAEVALMPEVAGALFYERLFEVNPDFRALFNHDMRIQSMKLMTMLAAIVYHLHEPGEILPAIHDMGKRHVVYGVQDAHYAALGDCLLWMLEQVLGDGFTPAVRNAWAVCYDELAGQMKSATHG